MRIRPVLTIGVLVLCLALLSGCATCWPGADTAGGPTPAYKLLFYSRALIQATPTQRLAMLENARERYAKQPSAITAARLGLAYGQPGYKGYAPENGWRYSQKALAMDAAYWDPAATAFLRQIIALSVDNAEVRKQLAQAQEQTKTSTQQLADTRQRNHRLGRQLAQARHKLRALTRIETELQP